MVFRLFLWVLAIAIAAPAAAQQWPDPPPAQSKSKPKAKAPPDDVEELTPAQIRRAQELEQRPGSSTDMPQAVRRKTKNAQPRQIDCRGAFAQDSSHIRLAQVFGPENVAFTQVEGPDNSKLMASVLFPRDPTRRLEVLWNNEASRSGTQVIVINGKSNWAAPRGIKLGTQLAAVEKLNGKPFKLSGFSADGSTAADWQEGQLLKLQNGCKIGMRFVADPRAQQASAQLASTNASTNAKELLSSDAEVRALRPTVAEILIGY